MDTSKTNSWNVNCPACGRPNVVSRDDLGFNLLCAFCESGFTFDEPLRQERKAAKEKKRKQREAERRAQKQHALSSQSSGQSPSVFGGTEDSIVQLEGDGSFSVQVVGESGYQHVLNHICGGKTDAGHRLVIEALVVHDNRNRFDNQAVRVDIRGETVGHLSREAARIFRIYVKHSGHPGATVKCKAKIVGGWDRGPGDTGHYGVRIDLPKSFYYPMIEAENHARQRSAPTTAPHSISPVRIGCLTASVILVGVFGVCLCVTMLPTARYEPPDRSTANESGDAESFSDSTAIYASQELLKKFLKSPSSARFDASQSSYIIHRPFAGEAIVSGHFEALNPFGVLLKQPYTVDMVYRSRKFIPIFVSIDGETMFDARSSFRDSD